MLRSFGIATIALTLSGCAGGDDAGAGPAGKGGSGGNTGGTAGIGATGGAGGSGGVPSGGGTAGLGGAAGSGGSTGATGGTGGIGPDYSAGTWTLENLSKTPGTITHDGRVVFAGTQEIFAWSEPDSIDTSDQDIFAGTLGSMKAVTNDTKVQNAFPQLAVASGKALLVYNGYPGGDNDLYWAEGPDFSSPVNLTEPSDAPNVREDFSPSLVVDDGGSRAIAYLSAPLDFNGETEVRVLEWTGTPAALQPKSVMSGLGDCDDPAIVKDANGKLHVLSACGPLFEEQIQYATNASGTWQTKTLVSTTKGDMSTRLAITADGKKIYAAWVNSTGSVMFASSDLGGTWSTPEVAVVGGYSPVLAVDPAGRAVIAFHRDNTQKNADVFFTWSDTSGFHQPLVLTPNTDTTNEWLASAIAFDPASGNPQVLYAAIEAGTDPLNSDVWRAKFAP